LIEQALRFAFKASNNQAEYDALIARILLAKEMGAQSLLAKSDSLRVTGLSNRRISCQRLSDGRFAVFELIHVPSEQNARADLLTKLASSGKGGRQRTVIQENLKTPRTFTVDNLVKVHQVSTLKSSTLEGRRGVIGH